ncbi:hypothetical protein [Brucella pseudogrignonensis]|uniref:hypothetical protein n=1 Tax=Brucella pseudogrignonensis TaxID=419475 RepID=UPI0038D0D163
MHPRIEEEIRRSVHKAAKKGVQFNLSMVGLASALGVSRPTLYKHDSFIEKICARLTIERRRSEGISAVNALVEKIETKQETIRKLNKELMAARTALINLYSIFYENGIAVSVLSGHENARVGALVRSELTRYSREIDACPFCGASHEIALSSPVRILSFPSKKNEVDEGL